MRVYIVIKDHGDEWHYEPAIEQVFDSEEKAEIFIKADKRCDYEIWDIK